MAFKNFLMVRLIGNCCSMKYLGIITDVTWNSDNELLAVSEAGQPRGDCPYLNNLDSVGAAPPCQPQTSAIARIANISNYSRVLPSSATLSNSKLSGKVIINFVPIPTSLLQKMVPLRFWVTRL
jgi:hypothetical protein